MAGHSKWANIKHRKAKVDAKRGKLFSRVAKEIISAVKQGGPDQDANPRLRLALQRAKAVNLPKDNIERNIKKASSKDQADFTEKTFELYGEGGVGIIADVMTDNPNRIASEMRIVTKKIGSIASPGSVAFQFDRKGVIRFPKEERNEEAIFELVTEAGAEDFTIEEETVVVTTEPDQLMAVKEALDAQDVTCDEALLEMIPKTTVDCDEEAGQKNMGLIEALEALEDVDAVYHNMN